MRKMRTEICKKLTSVVLQILEFHIFQGNDVLFIVALLIYHYCPVDKNVVEQEELALLGLFSKQQTRLAVQLEKNIIGKLE